MNQTARQINDCVKEDELLEQIVAPLRAWLHQEIGAEEVYFYAWDEEMALCLPVREECFTQEKDFRFKRAVTSLINQVLSAGQVSAIDPVSDHPLLGPVGPPYVRNVVLLPYVLGSKPLGVLALVNIDQRRLQSERPALDLIVTPTLLALRDRWQVRQMTLQNQELSQFISIMSHELRTPISVIQGNVAVLKERLFGDISPDQEKRLTIIERNAGDLLRLIQGILDISRPEEGRMPVYLEKFNVNELLNEVHAEFSDLFEKKGLTFQVRGKLPDDLMLSDRMKVKEILHNLVSNAMKFTKRGGVQIEAHRLIEGDRFEFSVQDTGIGIRNEDLDQIFDLFFQVDSSDQREHGGTGIGLHIVKRLVKRLQGKIRVESRFGRGTTFRIALPRELSEQD